MSMIHNPAAEAPSPAARISVTKFPLYFYEVESGQQTQDFWPTHYVDITAVAGRKKSACYANTLTVEGWWPIHEQMQRSRGNEKGCQFAEAFNRHPQSPNEPALSLPYDPGKIG